MKQAIVNLVHQGFVKNKYEKLKRTNSNGFSLKVISSQKKFPTFT